MNPKKRKLEHISGEVQNDHQPPSKRRKLTHHELIEFLETDIATREVMGERKSRVRSLHSLKQF
jgi:hypothetical protein